jgi:hypothetical protein
MARQSRVYRRQTWQQVKAQICKLTYSKPNQIHVERFDDHEWHGWIISLERSEINPYILADLFKGGLVIGDHMIYIEDSYAKT